MDAVATASQTNQRPLTVSDPHRAAVEAALDGAVVRYPELARPRAALDPDLRLTPAFAQAMRDASIPYGRRSLLLRILIGDPTAGGPRVAHAVRGATLQRFIDWATAIGAMESGNGEREDIPKGFAALLGVGRGTFAGFVADALVRPWWALQTGAQPALPALANLPASDLAPLETAFNARRMTLAAAEGMLAADSRSPKQALWFFETGCAALDLRNALVFLSALFAANREGGRIQNRIPVGLSARWKLRRLSVPDAMGFADVASLATRGMLRLDGVEDEWLGLSGALASPQAVALVAGAANDVDAAIATAQHASRWILASTRAELALERLRHGDSAGTFDTGLMFNCTRLIRRQPFDVFAGYYRTADPDAIAASAAADWGLPADMLRSIVQSIAPDAPAIAVRDFGNILALLTALRVEGAEDAWPLLPNVARFALGAPEPRSGGPQLRGAPSRHPTDSLSSQRRGQLPLLEPLLAGRRMPEAVLLRPGAVPPAGAAQCFVARADAAGRRLPPGVAVVGSPSLAWDGDPIADAAQILRRQGYRVRIVPA